MDLAARCFPWLLPLTAGARRPADLRRDADPREPGRAAEGRRARQHQELLQVQPHLAVPIRPALPQGHQRQRERVQGLALKERDDLNVQRRSRIL